MPAQLRARYVVTPNGVRQNATIAIDNARFVAPDPAAPTDDLGEVAIIPGLVNAHSHAFQRLIRGRTEWVPKDQPAADFWSWRQLMYGAANALDPDQIEAVSRMAFMEMACAGITTVGEFHYLHHQPDGTPYPVRTELANRVVAAARSVGIRITLLRVAYGRGGSGEPLSANQRRFGDSVEQAIADVADLSRGGLTKRYGWGWHPIACARVDRAGLARAADFDGPLHIHVCEQRAEIEQSLAEHGVAPIELLQQTGLLGPRTTLVHATHLAAGDVERIAAASALVCACPTTEPQPG